MHLCWQRGVSGAAAPGSLPGRLLSLRPVRSCSGAEGSAALGGQRCWDLFFCFLQPLPSEDLALKVGAPCVLSPGFTGTIRDCSGACGVQRAPAQCAYRDLSCCEQWVLHQQLDSIRQTLRLLSEGHDRPADLLGAAHSGL